MNSVFADGVTIEHLPDGDRRIHLGDLAVHVDSTVARALEGDATVSQPFRNGAELALGRLGLLRTEAVSEPPRPAVSPDGPCVGIVIPNRDGGALLAATLASIEVQTYAQVDVCVVDGGSVDDSAAIAKGFGTRWVDVPVGTGFGEACNAGAVAVEGEYILILNNDTELEPDFLAQMVAVAEGDRAAIAGVAPMVRRGDMRAVVESLGNVLGTRGFGAGRLAGLIDVGQFTQSEELFGAPFTAALLRRSVWDEIGPMDERFDFYYEDVEWCTRARLAGYDIVSAPHAIVYHVGSASLGQELSPRKLEMVTRNRLLWAASSLRAKTFVRFGGSYAREDLLRVARSLRAGDRKEAAAVASAWAGAVRRAPASRARRRATLENHTLPMRGLLEIAQAPPPFYDEVGAVLVTEPVVRAWYLRAAQRAARS